jgi:drug/metabolite transporter (DMT)-like permease
MRKNDEYVIGWLRMIGATPFLFVLLFFYPLVKLDIIFWRTLVFLLPLEVVSYLLYLKAIRISELSLTLPFLSLTPVFTILTSLIILGERLKFLGIAGICSITFGAYLLNISAITKGLFEPFKVTLKEKGPRFMIIVAFIYSITSNLGKLAIIHSSVTSFPIIYFPLVGLILTPLASIRLKQHLSKIEVSFKTLSLYFILGFVFFLAILTHSLAISKTNVAYMISVKRMSLIFGTFYGGIVFKERIRFRILGALFMLFGVILITLS